ncbi:SDR family oxidoreductase, partial [Streptomyces chartreusis]|uniref:SDR family oxidoreductase n=1 Tax=Streptomyces chartreusis TaxID=1969 RepID=UPI0033B6EA46
MRAPFLLVAALVLGVVRRQDGSIVLIGSGPARIPAAVGAAYGASKVGTEMLARSWALEFGPSGVRVNAASLVAVHVEGTRRCSAGARPCSMGQAREGAPGVRVKSQVSSASCSRLRAATSDDGPVHRDSPAAPALSRHPTGVRREPPAPASCRAVSQLTFLESRCSAVHTICITAELWRYRHHEPVPSRREHPDRRIGEPRPRRH